MHHSYYANLTNQTDSNLIKDFGAIFSSLVALALGGGLGKYLIRFFWKPRLKITGLKSIYQHYNQPNTSDLKIWRISIKNIGNAIAKDTQADIIKIKDNNVERKNFIPLPLQWTHHNSTRINISPDKTVYIDVLKLVLDKKSQKLYLASPFATNIPDMIEIKQGKKSIYLRFFEARGIALPTVKIEINWKGEHSNKIARLVYIR